MSKHFQLIQEPISGADLLSAYAKCIDIISREISDNPLIAVNKIIDKFQSIPTLSGNNIPGIIEIRDKLFEICKSKRIINAFSIVAAHTHWHDKMPIIYTYDLQKKEYIIGPHKIENEGIYYPVSFVFYNDFPLPYEWCYLIPFKDAEYKKAYEIIVELNNSFHKYKYQLGISIDFRFKKSIFDKPIASVELPIIEKEDHFYGFSKYISYKSFSKNNLNITPEQVAWHPYSDSLLRLNRSELKLLNDLRSELFLENGKTLDEKMAIIETKYC